MFGMAPRFPLVRALALVAIGVLVGSLLAGGGSGLAGGLGVLLLLPLFLFKMLFLFMLFGFLLRFIGPWSASRGPWPGDWADRRGQHASPPTRDRADWEESLRWARRQVDRVDETDRPARGPQPADDPDGPQDDVVDPGGDAERH